MLTMLFNITPVSNESPIHDCDLQIRKLESTLMDLENKTLWNDYRMAQPLYDRVVESSFLPRLGKGSMYIISQLFLLNSSGFKYNFLCSYILFLSFVSIL